MLKYTIKELLPLSLKELKVVAAYCKASPLGHAGRKSSWVEAILEAQVSPLLDAEESLERDEFIPSSPETSIEESEDSENPTGNEEESQESVEKPSMDGSVPTTPEPVTLFLVLKHEWFNLIASGEKKEEYREIKPYWESRLFSREFNQVTFIDGYKPNADRVTLPLLGIRKGQVNPRWAPAWERGEEMLILDLGEIKTVALPRGSTASEEAPLKGDYTKTAKEVIKFITETDNETLPHSAVNYAKKMEEQYQSLPPNPFKEIEEIFLIRLAELIPKPGSIEPLENSFLTECFVYHGEEHSRRIEFWRESQDWEMINDAWEDLYNSLPPDNNINDIDDWLDQVNLEIPLVDWVDVSFAYNQIGKCQVCGVTDTLNLSSVNKWVRLCKKCESGHRRLMTRASLNPGQQIAIGSLEVWWKQGRLQQASLSGPAGTGKTFMVGHLLKKLKIKSVVFLTPTHKAKKVLKVALENSGMNGAEVFTVAQALGKQPWVSESGGVNFETLSPGFINNYQLVIVDEASMIGKQDFQEIAERAERILWMGDRYQLPPINESQSLAFSDVKTNAELSQVMRYTGHILKECEKLRSGVDAGKIYRLEPDQKSIQYLTKSDWYESAANFFRSDEFSKNTSLCRILAYRNKVVDKHNNRLKFLIYGHNKAFFLGQRLIACNPVSRLILTEKGSTWQILATNSEEMIVVSDPIKKSIGEEELQAAPKLCKLHLRGEMISFQCESESGIKFDSIILLPSAVASKQHLAEMLKESTIPSREKQFTYKFLNAWGDTLKDIFAITTHKAQGSTFNHVFLDVGDILTPPSKKEPGSPDDRPRLLYTAASRASEDIFLM